MRIPPSLHGHGGSQRAWRLVESLRRFGEVNFVLISRKADLDAASVSLKPLESLVASVTSIDIPEWQPTRREQLWSLPRINTGWGDLVRMRSHEAPVISPAGLERIAEQMPVRSADLIFAGRLPSAVVVQALIDRGYLNATSKIVDFDDIMSRFRDRQRRFGGASLGRQGRLLARIDTRLIQRAERRIATSWDSVCVCTTEDVAILRSTYPGAHVVKVPNVIDRPWLPPRPDDGTVRLLFVGSLGFSPNIHGLRVFLTEAWPRIRGALANVTLAVVGMHPDEEVRKLLAQHGVELHANVPTAEPYYASCDIVVAPILFGSGTRIKIMEAMAYGRPVVATPMGAEGLDLIADQHLLMAGTMEAFADATVALAGSRSRRLQIAEVARDFMIREYCVAAMAAGMERMVNRDGTSDGAGGPRSQEVPTEPARSVA
jgi:glycosyltransferase involved in cell wall biosynthesis